MGPVTEMETEGRSRQAGDGRHRVLIAAAVAALLGTRARILEIDLAEEPSGTGRKHSGRVPAPVKRAVLRRRIQIRTKAVRKEEQRETSDHA